MREDERKQMEQRGLVDRQDVRKDLKDAISFVGSCEKMCPTFERIRRTYENNVKKLEKDPATGKVTEDFAVKAFSRPAAGQPPPLPSDVRPPRVLRSTLDYLINKAIPALPSSHSFLWDRTRSVRQDFTYQNYAGEEAIDCNELIARIHIVCLHVMAGSDQEYSKQQELEQFNKTLQSLSEFYSERRKRGLPDSPREPEMRAYQLLSHLKDPDIERQIQTLPDYIVDDSQVQLALKLRALIQQNGPNTKWTENCPNFFSVFFNLLREAPYLFCCLLESSFNEIRLLALKSLGRACHARSKPYLISRITTMLGFDNDEETLEYCTYYKLPHVDDSIEVASYSDQVVAEQPPKAQPYSALVESKLAGRTLIDVIYDGDSFGGMNLKSMSSSTKKPAIAFQQNQPFPNKTTDLSATPKLTSLDKTTDTSKLTSSTQIPSNFGFEQLGKSKPVHPGGLFQSVPNQSAAPPAAAEPSKPIFTAFGNEKEEATKTEQKPTVASSAELFKPKEAELAVQKTENRPPEPRFTEKDVNQELDRLLQSVVHDAVSRQSVPYVWNEILSTRQVRRKFIADHAENIFDGMIKEVVRYETIKAISTNHDMERLLKSMLKKIRIVAAESKHRANLKRKWAEEVSNVSSKLGRTNSGRGYQKSRSKRPAPSAETHVQVVNSAQAEAKQLWAPLDIQTIMIPKLESKFRSAKRFDRSLVVSVFCQDWDSTTGRWVRAKLGMQEVATKPGYYEGFAERNDTTVTFASLINSRGLFERTGALVFECGIQSLDVDRERLAEIVECLRISKYEIVVVLLYFGQEKEQNVRSALGDNLAVKDNSKNNPITGKSLVFCPVGGSDDSRSSISISQQFSYGMNQLASKFTADLSEHGKREQEALMRERDLAAARRKQAEDRKKLGERQKEEQERYRELNKFKSLGPQNRIVSAAPPPPALPLEGPVQLKKRTWQQRDLGSSSRKKSEVIPKSIESLNSLVASVTKKPRN